MQGQEEPQASTELQPHKHSRAGTALPVIAICCRGPPLESLHISQRQDMHPEYSDEKGLQKKCQCISRPPADMTSLAGYEASDERLRNGQSLKTCPHVQLCQHHIPSRRRLPPRQARAVATHRAGAALLHTQLSPERTLPPKRHAPRYPHAEALDYHAFALCAHAQGCCSTSMLSIPRHAGDLSCMDQCLLYAPVCSHSPTVSRLTCYLSQHHTQTCNEAPCSENCCGNLRRRLRS